MNLCLEYLRDINKSLGWYSGLCYDLALETVKWAEAKGIPAKALRIDRGNHCLLTPRALNDVRWTYHYVVEAGGKIHDAWFPDVVDRKTYLWRNFGHHTDLQLKENA